MSINPNPTHPRKTNRKSSPEHVDSIRNIETGIDKTNRLKKIRVANRLQKLAFEFVDDDVGKVQKDFMSKIPNKITNRMNRIIKLEDTLPPSK